MLLSKRARSAQPVNAEAFPRMLPVSRSRLSRAPRIRVRADPRGSMVFLQPQQIGAEKQVCRLLSLGFGPLHGRPLCFHERFTNLFIHFRSNKVQQYVG